MISFKLSHVFLSIVLEHEEQGNDEREDPGPHEHLKESADCRPEHQSVAAETGAETVPDSAGELPPE